MPITVNPGFVWPPDVDPVVSPDGRITVIADPSHAGALLRADYSDLEPAVLAPSLATSPSSWTMKDANSLIVDYPNSPDGKAIRLQGATSPAAYGPFIPTAAGDVWNLEGVVSQHDATTATVNLRVYFYTSSQAYITSLLAAGGVGSLSGSAVTPTGAAYARYGIVANGQPSPGWLAVHSMRGSRSGDKMRSVAQVRFERNDGAVVRSGDPAWAPGGWAHAYDHEAPLGVGVQWRAVPIQFDGTEGEPSDWVGTMLDPVTDGFVWLKPGDPNLALKVKIEPLDRTWNGRVDSTSIAGAHTPAVSWDVLEGPVSEIRLLVRDRETEQKLMRVLDAGPVLVQLPTCAGVEDFWFIRDKVQADEIHWDGYPVRRFSIGVVPVSRPATVDSPLYLPGLSYDTVARDFASYDDLAVQVSSYNTLLEL